MRNFASHQVDVRHRTSGVIKTICNQCLPTRHNKRDRSLRVNIDTGHCHCYHCGADFYVPDDNEEREKAERRAAAVPQHFRRPVFDASKTTLSEATERWLVETRCIPQSVIAALRITEQEEFMPESAAKERCVCFNYFEGGQLVNTKFRSGKKHFKMVQGAELIPYNIDSVVGQTSCIIHEGELDAASSTAADLHGDLRALFDNGFGPGAETGWEEMDKICTYERRRVVIVTGIPGAGKSEWVDELVLRLCLRHQWKIGFFSPENVPIAYHLRKLIEKLTAHRFQNGCGMTESLLARSEEFLTENVSHISLKGDATPERVIAKARELVVRRGCRIFVFDPFNRFDHDPKPGQSETQYLSNLLNKFTEFATQNNCLLIVVAHPRKMNRNPATGVTPRVEMYDINGTADFYNKADYGIVVERDKEIGITRVYVEKVKFKHLGTGGVAAFVYDPVSGRYLPCEESHDPAVPVDQRARNTVFDNSCWLPEKELFE